MTPKRFLIALVVLVAIGVVSMLIKKDRDERRNRDAGRLLRENWERHNGSSAREQTERGMRPYQPDSAK